MSKVRVHSFSMSLDGFGAGPDQRLDQPMGRGGQALHEWIFTTASGQAMIGGSGGSTGLDSELFAARGEGSGATIIGRNMFGPVRGPWEEHAWDGWWGEEPPFGHDVFVLTHHERAPLEMLGGTTFHFTAARPREVLELAKDAAGGRDVVLGGGVATLRAFLAEDLVDEMHLAIAPVLLGNGERLFDSSLPAAPSLTCDALLRGESGVSHALLRRG